MPNVVVVDDEVGNGAIQITRARDVRTRAPLDAALDAKQVNGQNPNYADADEDDRFTDRLQPRFRRVRSAYFQTNQADDRGYRVSRKNRFVGVIKRVNAKGYRPDDEGEDEEKDFESFTSAVEFDTIPQHEQ